MELIIIAGLIWLGIRLMRRSKQKRTQPSTLSPAPPRPTVTGPKPRTARPAVDKPALFTMGAFGRTGQHLDAPFAAIDIETTGFAPTQHRIVEVAVVNMTIDGTITGEWSTIVHGNGATGGSKIHGLPPSKRAGAPGFEDIADEFLARLSGHIVVAHNARFEEQFLVAELLRTGRALEQIPALCTLITARRAFPHLGGHKLEQCCSEAGVPQAGAHTALGDARAVAGLVPLLLGRTGPPRYQGDLVKFPDAMGSQALPRPT